MKTGFRSSKADILGGLWGDSAKGADQKSRRPDSWSWRRCWANSRTMPGTGGDGPETAFMGCLAG